jgi:hypothetical protein
MAIGFHISNIIETNIISQLPREAAVSGTMAERAGREMLGTRYYAFGTAFRPGASGGT